MIRIAILLLLSGCATVTPDEYADAPPCDRVTVSVRAGSHHWPECRIEVFYRGGL